MTRVSVVMPVFNGERWIAEAVKSVLSSTYRDFELLVLDDGSTDGSRAAAIAAAASDPRVRVIPLEHGGIAATRNAGLEHSRGEFIANLDADDAMFPERLGRQVAFLDAHPECVAVGTRSVVVNDDGIPVGIVGRYFTHEDIDRSLLQGNGGAIGNDTAMIRKQVAIDVGRYSVNLRATGEDHDMWLRLAEAGRLVCVPDVLNRYRIHANNTSRGAGSKDRRLPVTLHNIERAFARRGIKGRTPEKVKQAPMKPVERWRDRALLAYYRGATTKALVRALGALAASPFDASIRAALRQIRSGPTPRWW
ncbi:MAG: glycosyltransferase family A protein [Gemmatimonadaceae bacterium]